MKYNPGTFTTFPHVIAEVYEFDVFEHYVYFSLWCRKNPNNFHVFIKSNDIYSKDKKMSRRCYFNIIKSFKERGLIKTIQKTNFGVKYSINPLPDLTPIDNLFLERNHQEVLDFKELNFEMI